MGASAEHVPEGMSSQKLDLIITKLQKEFEDFYRQQHQHLSETDRIEELDVIQEKQHYQMLLQTDRQGADTYLKRLYDKNPRLAWKVDPERAQQINLDLFEDSTSSVSPHSPHASSHASPHASPHASSHQDVLSVPQQDTGMQAILAKAFEKHQELRQIVQNPEARIIHPDPEVDQTIQIYKGPERSITYTAKEIRLRHENIFLIQDKDGHKIWVEFESGAEAAGKETKKASTAPPQGSGNTTPKERYRLVLHSEVVLHKDQPAVSDAAVSDAAVSDAAVSDVNKSLEPASHSVPADEAKKTKRKTTIPKRLKNYRNLGDYVEEEDESQLKKLIRKRTRSSELEDKLPDDKPLSKRTRSSELEDKLPDDKPVRKRVRSSELEDKLPDDKPLSKRVRSSEDDVQGIKKDAHSPPGSGDTVTVEKQTQLPEDDVIGEDGGKLKSPRRSEDDLPDHKEQLMEQDVPGTSQSLEPPPETGSLVRFPKLLEASGASGISEIEPTQETRYLLRLPKLPEGTVEEVLSRFDITPQHMPKYIRDYGEDINYLARLDMQNDVIRYPDRLHAVKTIISRRIEGIRQGIELESVQESLEDSKEILTDLKILRDTLTDEHIKNLLRSSAQISEREDYTHPLVNMSDVLEEDVHTVQTVGRSLIGISKRATIDFALKNFDSLGVSVLEELSGVIDQRLAVIQAIDPSPSRNSPFYLERLELHILKQAAAEKRFLLLGQDLSQKPQFTLAEFSITTHDIQTVLTQEESVAFIHIDLDDLNQAELQRVKQVVQHVLTLVEEQDTISRLEELEKVIIEKQQVFVKVGKVQKQHLLVKRLRELEAVEPVQAEEAQLEFQKLINLLLDSQEEERLSELLELKKALKLKKVELSVVKESQREFLELKQEEEKLRELLESKKLLVLEKELELKNAELSAAKESQELLEPELSAAKESQRELLEPEFVRSKRKPKGTSRTGVVRSKRKPKGTSRTGVASSKRKPK